VEKLFVALREAEPGAAWLERFRAGRAEAERWYLGSGLDAPPSAAACRIALRAHMPELVPLYDHACTLVGDDEMAHRIISHYRPAPLATGCTQAIWLGEGGPALVRNYDFPLDVVSSHFESTAWFGREVVSKGQRPWGGVIDGMNEDGLVASLTFGGRPVVGPGFSIILVLRYVLETCRTVDQGVAALSRIPLAQPQNVTLLDPSGAYATLFLGPDREPALSRLLACANHQEPPLVADSSVERQSAALTALQAPGMTLDGLASRFLEPPLYSRFARSTTVYSAIYRPAEGCVDYLWPGKTWRRRIGAFETGIYAHEYGELV
jgi:predicted choloylglycine hydrolase